CIFIGKCSGNLFPVRASATTPPLRSLCSSIQGQKTKPGNHQTPSPEPNQQLSALYHGKYRNRALITEVIPVGTRYLPASRRPPPPCRSHNPSGMPHFCWVPRD